MHPNSIITVRRFNRVHTSSNCINTNSTRIRIVSKTLAWIQVHKSILHTRRWIHRGVHKTKVQCSHTIQHNRFICVLAPVLPFYCSSSSSYRIANVFHRKCQSELHPSPCNSVAMIQRDVQCDRMGMCVCSNFNEYSIQDFIPLHF